MKNKRLSAALSFTEGKRLERVERKKSKRAGDVSVYERKLTQQEAAAYCGVSLHRFREWQKKGLRSVHYGKRRRFLVADLQKYMQTKMKQKS